MWFGLIFFSHIVILIVYFNFIGSSSNDIDIILISTKRFYVNQIHAYRDHE